MELDSPREALNLFHTLLSSQGSVLEDEILETIPSLVTEEDNKMLTSPPNMEEVQKEGALGPPTTRHFQELSKAFRMKFTWSIRGGTFNEKNIREPGVEPEISASSISNPPFLALKYWWGCLKIELISLQVLTTRFGSSKP
ncbi:hypothetical protein HAX54_043920 [Datura stramonium]|uniref:Uncharacterized protein n=1 Tax=Datura stramonium TaxID=4076 RepID=A0ABS8W692_DATST|nr:hypothetical protein [Datura stramonium]